MSKAAYIHIPFCRFICPYCDFCKVLYQENIVKQYLEALAKEIKETYQGDMVSSIYIGGGTPSSLTCDQLEELFKILQLLKREKTIEYTIECNVLDIERSKVALFKKYGINRISVGIETSVSRLQKIIQREVSKEEIRGRIALLKEEGFSNINVDLMYALKNETMKELEEDLRLFTELDVPHISTYSLIIEPHTKFFLENMKEMPQKLDADMYALICKTLKKKNYIHYEVSNFAKSGFQSSHNMTYWNNEEYYGFGAGASFYYQNQRGCNSRNVFAYINGIFKREIEIVKDTDKMDDFVWLGLRKKEGLSKEAFRKLFQVSLKDVYAFDHLIQQKVLIEDDAFIYLDERYFYVMDTVLVDLLASKKDKKELQTFV